MGLAALPLIAAVAYILAPGHPDVPFGGAPIGVSGIVLIVAIVTAGWWARGALVTSTGTRTAAALLTAAVAGKLAIGLLAPPSGWLARYYGNADFKPPIERSIDYPALDGTRIDRTIDFTDTEFPVHFFNDHRYRHGFRREYTDAFSVHWTGYAHLDTSELVRLSVEHRGPVRLSVDGSAVMPESDIDLMPGDHAVEVWYQKPADTEGRVRIRGLNRVTPAPISAWQRTLRLPFVVAAWALHALALLAFAWWAIPRNLGTRERWNPGTLAPWNLGTLEPWIAPAVIGGLVLQGCWKARHVIDRVWTLTGGDDWFEYESSARDVVVNGLMMTQGAAVGHGQPFFAYPGYIYFVALIHRLTGEALAGVIVVNFLLLALASLLVFRLARLVVGTPAAFAALAWLLLIEQAAFTRYYTVTLFSENLFFLTAALTVLGVTLHLLDDRLSPLIWAALAGGASALTRPSMMLMLPFIAALLLVHHWRRRSAARGAGVALLLVAVWMAAVAPATIRNYIMAGDPVLISSGQAATFVNYNLPSGDVRHYREAFQGTMVSAAKILIWMFVDHPLDLLRNFWIKLGFSLGMVHWMGDVRPHPELLMTGAGYVLAMILVPAARTVAALPLHCFVLTHLAALLLTMPSNYGYRLILPMYLFMPVFAAAVPLQFVRRRRG